MKSVKKIIAVLFVICMVISASGVLSFAADSFNIDRSTGDQCYKVEIVSSLDEKQGTVYIKDSLINIYKVPDGSTASPKLIDNKYLYGKVTTNKDGRAYASVVPGTYIVKESNFKHDGKEYKAEYLTFTVNEKTNYFIVYLKHSLVSSNIIKNTDDGIDNPFTGDDVWPTYICIGIILISVPCIIILTKKYKDEDKKPKKKKEK